MILPPQTLVHTVINAAGYAGDARGFTFYHSPTESSVLSFAALDERARSIAVELGKRGFVAGDVVMIAISPGLSFIQTVYGALYAGLIIAPVAMAGIGTTATTERLAGIVRTSGARAILAEGSVVTTFADGRARVELGAEVMAADELLSGEAGDWTPPALDGDSVAALLFTSGSTGEPKGVMVTHRTAVAACAAIVALVDLSSESVYAGWVPLHLAMGLVVQVFLPTYLAGSAVLTSTAQFQRRPVFWLQMLSSHRATYTVAGNFAFDLCSRLTTAEQLAEIDLSSVTAFMSGSEPVRTDTVKRFADRFAEAGLQPGVITPAFGSTEGMLLTAKVPGVDLFIADFDASALEVGALVRADGQRSVEMVSCGRLAPGFSMRIVEPETGVSVADSNVGEIWFAGPSVSPGYWRNPEATRETFGHHIEGDPREYYRSGDLGAIVDGELFITGRVKDLIIIRGRNIYPQDLEAAAARVHPSIGVAAAFELADSQVDVGIVLEYDPDMVPASDLAGLADDVRTALVKQFSLPFLTVAFVAPGGIPRTASGKVRRSTARTLLAQEKLDIVLARG